MINKILEYTRGKPCSCRPGKKCPGCKKKIIVHPQVYVEEPRKFPAPVTITYYKPSKYNQNQTVQYLEKPTIWQVRKQSNYEPEKKTTPICRWYKRRKALKQLIAEHKKEQKLLEKQRRDEYERERLKELIKWEREREKFKPLSSISRSLIFTRNKRSTSLPPIKKEKIYIKERSASVKPRAQSKSVAVKRYNTKETISRRFVNYCYRLCCQFYCYLTCIILVIIIVICII